VALLELTRKQAELESREKLFNDMSGTPSTAGGAAEYSSMLSVGESLADQRASIPQPPAG